MIVTEFEQDRLLTMTTPAEASNPFRESYRIEPLSEGVCGVHFTVDVGNVSKLTEYFMRPAMKKDQPKNAARLKSILASRTQEAS